MVSQEFGYPKIKPSGSPGKNPGGKKDRGNGSGNGVFEHLSFFLGKALDRLAVTRELKKIANNDMVEMETLGVSFGPAAKNLDGYLRNLPKFAKELQNVEKRTKKEIKVTEIIKKKNAENIDVLQMADALMVIKERKLRAVEDLRLILSKTGEKFIGKNKQVGAKITALLKEANLPVMGR